MLIIITESLIRLNAYFNHVMISLLLSVGVITIIFSVSGLKAKGNWE